MPVRKSVRKNKKQTRRTRGKKGGCGCGMKGGSLGLAQLSSSNYYPLNKVDADPNYFSLATRSIVGGRRTKRVKKCRRLHGGSISSDMVKALHPIVQNTVVGAGMYNQQLPYSSFRVSTA